MNHNDFEKRWKKINQEYDDYIRFLIGLGIVVGALALTGLGISIYNAFTY